MNVDHNAPRACGRKGYAKINVTDEDTGKVFSATVAKPSRLALETGLTFLAESKLVSAGECVIRQCWVSGDSEIWQDESNWVSACLKACELLQVKSSELEKL